MRFFLLVFGNLIWISSLAGKKPFAPGVTRHHGVYIEKWDGVDSYEIQKMLDDSRYPYLPTWRGYSTNFAQPSNWGDNFGTRIRTYFVPKMTGYHVFYISSNNDGRLYLSRDDDENHKSLIASETGVRYSAPLQYDKYREQKSFPVSLIKGQYYFMEAMMKSYFDYDNLDVAVETPDGKMHAPIPSEYLWTATEETSTTTNTQNQTASYLLLKVAAKAGAMAGIQAGIEAAHISGGKAGAKAGAAAGKRLGSKAGAEAGAQAAKSVITKTIELALKAYNANKGGHIINVFTNRNAKASHSKNTQTSKVSQSQPGQNMLAKEANQGKGGAQEKPPESGAGAGASGGAAAGAGAGVGASGAAAAGAGAGAGAGTSIGSATGAAGATAGSGASAGSSLSQNASIASSSGFTSTGDPDLNSPITTHFAGGKNQAETTLVAITPYLGLSDKVLSSGFLNPKLPFPISSRHLAKYVYVPKGGEDPGVMARKIVNELGFPSKLVLGAYYTIHSMNLPDTQTNGTDNMCFRSMGSYIKLNTVCNYFKIVNGFRDSEFGKYPLAFESACLPGYYLTQRNYKLVLAPREKTQSFEKSATFKMMTSVVYPSSMQIMSLEHLYWFICESGEKNTKRANDIEMRYTKTSEKFISECSFYFFPMPQNGNPKMFCKNVLGEKMPSIPGQKLPEEEKKPLPPLRFDQPRETCVAINFINEAAIPFYIDTDIKHEPYLVDGGNFKLRTTITNPTLHRHVTLKGRDPSGKNIILLSGASSIIVEPKNSCKEDDFYKVTVTSKPEILLKKPTENPEGNKTQGPPVHYHYHYHNPAPPPPPPPPVCPTNCANNQLCPPTCPQQCCKKDTVHYIDAKSVISRMKAKEKCNIHCKRRCGYNKTKRIFKKNCQSCQTYCEKVL